MERDVLETSSDRYVIVEQIGAGGMGAIFLGKKVEGGREVPVVLKQLLPEYTNNPRLIEMFLREAEVTSTLDHPNIVRLLDLVSTGNEYFMVMEYIRGGNLQELIKRSRHARRQFSVGTALFIGIEVARALRYAHERRGENGQPLGLVHRDVTPSNILISDEGEVKLADFGIAKAPDLQSVVFKIKGKVGYMAPEQAKGLAVDARADLFSLGVVLYETLVGEKLFVGDLLSTASMIYSQPIVPPSTKRPDVPAELDAVILRALSLDPEGRFTSAAELEQVLISIARTHRLSGNASTLSGELREMSGEKASIWARLDETFNEKREGAAVTGRLELDDQGNEPSFAAFESAGHTGTMRLPEGEITSVLKMRRGFSERIDVSKPAGAPVVEHETSFDEDAAHEATQQMEASPATTPIVGTEPTEPISTAHPQPPKATQGTRALPKRDIESTQPDREESTAEQTIEFRRNSPPRPQPQSPSSPPRPQLRIGEVRSIEPQGVVSASPAESLRFEQTPVVEGRNSFAGAAFGPLAVRIMLGVFAAMVLLGAGLAIGYWLGGPDLTGPAGTP